VDRNVTRRRLLQGAAAGAAGASLPLVSRPTPALARQETWSLAKAAEPYKGVEINAPFLQRPAYAAAAKMIPEFESESGIKVAFETMPYENSREKQILAFTAGTAQYDVALIDLVWLGEFAASEWIVPLERFYDDPDLADPALDLDGFFPILLEATGTWNGVIYGLPFDNYSGFLYYNRDMLNEAGFAEPPESWQVLYDQYGPALTKDDRYAFALQSRRGETQSADSFMRMVWAFGGSLIDPETFEPNLSSPESLAGLRFRQDLMRYMPPDVVEWDHDETVQALAQGRVAMITEWSAFYPTLSNPETSVIADSLGVTIEPAGADGEPHPALGGISLGINAQSPEEKQAAAWLFIQWLNSEAKANEYIQYGGISGRMKPYDDQELAEQYPYFAPLVLSFSQYANPVFRPRFPEWPQISEIIAQTGSEIMLGSGSIEDGVQTIEEQMRQILKPYIEGDKPKLQ